MTTTRKAIGAVRAGMTIGAGVTAAALTLGFLVPPLRGVADMLLEPGAFLPEWYWGGLHDPLQILAALALNVIFYAFASVCARTAWEFIRRASMTR
jgi:hypothetical protein